jgi:hypothetical protein
MRTTVLLVALAGMTAGAAAQTTANATAQLTSTIQPAGPRTGVNNDRFFNVEGAANGTFASYGVCRWDLSAIRGQFDVAYGAGQWQITKIELEMSQSNAAFSAAGAVAVYYSTDDTTDIKTAAGGLQHPFSDGPGLTDLALGNGGNHILSYQYINVGATTGTIDRYTQTGSLQNGAPLSAAEILTLAPDLVADITGQNILTLVFVDADPIVAATYRGQEPFLGVVGPNLFITAEPSGVTPTCYANCDASTVAPVLNVQDFACFLNSFAAGESYANCDNSTTAPVLNVQDFSCFLNSFAAGCP